MPSDDALETLSDNFEVSDRIQRLENFRCELLMASPIEYVSSFVVYPLKYPTL